LLNITLDIYFIITFDHCIFSKSFHQQIANEKCPGRQQFVATLPYEV